MIAENSSVTKRIGISVLLIVGTLAVAAFGFQLLAEMKPEVAKRETELKVYNVDAFIAERVNIEEVISGFGTAQCDREVVIAAQVNGEIVEIHPRLKIGSRVSDGTDTKDGKTTRDGADVLVKIDAQPYQERVTQSQNRLDEVDAEIATLEQQIENNDQLLKKAQQDYKAFEAEYERIKSARAKGVATASEKTRSLLELQKYQDNVLQFQAESKMLPLNVASARQRQKSLTNDLTLARIEMSRTTVTPRFSGRLSDVMVELGQFVRAGEPIVRVSDLSRVEVAIPLPLSEYSKLEQKIRDGEQPLVKLAPNETSPDVWTGRLVRVAPEADRETRTVMVFVMVDNDQQTTPLLPGTFVHVRIDGPVLQDAIPIPRDAIHNGNIYVAIDNAVKVRPAVVTETLQTLAIIEESVQPGEQVILTNLDIIFADAPVAVQRTRRLNEEVQSQRSQLARIKPATTPAAPVTEEQLTTP